MAMSSAAIKVPARLDCQFQRPGSSPRPPPNASILALGHAAADSDSGTALDELNHTTRPAVARHVEEVAGRPAVFVNECTKAAK
jgi:hypothetical protein